MSLLHVNIMLTYMYRVIY